MQLSEGQIYGSLQHLLERVWKTHAQSITLLGEGVYGRTYTVTLECSPYYALIKIHKYPGMADQERRQLIELRVHVPVLVPHLYACLEDPDLGEALVMEWLPGQSCPRPEQFPRGLRSLLQRQAVDLLLKLHATWHQEGYGSFDGPFYPRWWDYYGQRVRDTSQAINCSEEARLYLGQEVLALMDRTLTYGEQVLNTSPGRPVLLHGDFCFGNLLFDPQTWRISGLIDPLDENGASENWISSM
jgi:aminoglycoside phosphotransferase (APT) family kinase protein